MASHKYLTLEKMAKHPFRKFSAKVAQRNLPISSLVFGAAPPGLPTSTNNSVNMGAIKDQGQEGSCTANASCSLREYWQKKQELTPVVPLSAQAFYWWEESYDGNQGKDDGANDGDYEDASQANGFCPETDDPYWSGNDTDTGTNTVIDLTKAPTTQMISDGFPYRIQFAMASLISEQFLYYNPHGYSLSDCIAMQLALGSPVMIFMIVPKQLEPGAIVSSYGNWVVDGQTYADMLLENGQLCGHAVVLVDYKPDPDPTHNHEDGTQSKLFKFQNSWGIGSVTNQTPWPAKTDTTGCAWITERFINAVFLNGTQQQMTIEDAFIMMGDPGCTYYAQVGPFTTQLAAATAGNALAAKGYAFDSTMYGTATTGYFVNAGPYTTIQLGMIAAGNINLLGYSVAPTLMSYLTTTGMTANPTYQ